MVKIANPRDRFSPQCMPMAALILIEITFVEKLHQFVIYPLHARNQNAVC